MKPFTITRSTFEQFVTAVDGRYEEYNQKQILEFEGNYTTLVHDPDEKTIEINRHEDFGVSIRATLTVDNCEIRQGAEDGNLLTTLSTSGKDQYVGVHRYGPVARYGPHGELEMDGDGLNELIITNE